MKVLPVGSFLMGSGGTSFDRPPHRVTFAKPFAIGLTEITFDDWALCMAAGGCSFKPDSQGFGEGNRPVINVSWTDANDYIAWLARKTGKRYRLPSEAEWEYAAKGGHTTVFAWGPTVGTGMANCADCGPPDPSPQTRPVRSFPPNGFGLFDMAGNAAEWVADCWNTSYRGAPRDGSAWLTGTCEQRVLRGGSFDSKAAYTKPSARFRYDADVRYWANGFRVVRELP
jgi:formylglycine-generating enzyme required for sulfatase activity